MNINKGYRCHCVVANDLLSGCQHYGQDALLTAYDHCLNDRLEHLDTFLVIDEVDRFSTTHKNHPILTQVVNEGRHLGINLLVACRRPAKINIDFTSLYDVLICHKLTHSKDLEYIADISEKEFAKKVSNIETPLIDIKEGLFAGEKAVVGFEIYY